MTRRGGRFFPALIAETSRAVITADAAQLSISASPALKPAFNLAISDYLVGGPFKVDKTKPRLAVTAKTADGKTYKAGNTAISAVKVGG
jgi:hypothetical protein